MGWMMYALFNKKVDCGYVYRHGVVPELFRDSAIEASLIKTLLECGSF